MMDGQANQSSSAQMDKIMVEKWNQFRNELKSEYDILVDIHCNLLKLDDNPELLQSGMMGLFDEYY